MGRDDLVLPARLGFGVFLAPFHAPFDNPTLALQRDLDLLEWIDDLGYDEAWIGEHHSCGWETISSPEIFIAAAAERTRRIRPRISSRLQEGGDVHRSYELGVVDERVFR